MLKKKGFAPYQKSASTADKKIKFREMSKRFFGAGFTLIEIMVAIGIVGILAAVVLVSMQSYGVKGRSSRTLAQASSVIPSMVSCAGNGGTPSFSGQICDLGSGYGSWPTFPDGYAVDASDWTSASLWYFSVTGESQTICCDSAMNSCGIISGTCDAAATW